MPEKKHLALPVLLKELTDCLRAVSGDESTQASGTETVASRMQSMMLVLIDNATKRTRGKNFDY